MKAPVLTLSLTLLALVTISCKTQEQVRRESMIDQMAVQVGQGQKSNAEVNLRLQSLQEQVSEVAGRVEEINHASQETQKEQMQSLKSQIEALEQGNMARDKEIDTLKATIEEQKKFIDQVLESLKEIGANKKSARGRSASKRSSKVSDYDQAMKDYEKGSYKNAKGPLSKFINDKKLTSSQRARALHNLAMIEYLEKNYESSMVFFSRLYTEYPKSSLNSSGLLHLGLSFKHLKKKQEAKQTLNELINRYPTSKNAKTAKSVLKQL